MAKRLFFLLIGGIFFILVILQIWFYFISLPVWKIQDILIINNEYIPKKMLMDNFSAYKDVSIFRVNRQQLQTAVNKDALLKNMIKKIELKKQFPSTLLINIHVKKPYLVFSIKDHLWLVDNEGFLLNRSEQLVPQPRQNIILIKGLVSIAEIENNVKTLKKLLDKLYLYFPENKIIVDSTDLNNIYLVFDNSFQVKVGDSGQATEKTKNLYYLLNYLKDRRPKPLYIDLRAIKNPVVKFK